MYMKQELLEYLVRNCVKEVLSQVREAEDPTQGAPAPPEAGQGTGDTPAIPNDTPSIPSAPSEPETPAKELKGVLLVNPRDKSKIQKVPLEYGNDAGLERDLHSIATTIAGAQAKVSLSAIRMSRQAVKNKDMTIYLYIGKFDPSSDENYLMADSNIQIAKDSSIESLNSRSNELPLPSDQFDPSVATDADYANNFAASKQGREDQEIDPDDVEDLNENLKKVIKSMVKNIINK